MTTVITKQSIANFRRARRAIYIDYLLSGEVSRKEIRALSSGFDDGMIAMLRGLIEMGHLSWAPEPTPIEPVQS